ncbi:MAG: hypothetical protein PWP24_1548 [Clostridiales bacterium]|nr:hypothetical protein [Clostridiales bacterium]
MGKQKREIDPIDERMYAIILRNQIPLLTLDARWHSLFPEESKTPKIRELEKNLNQLIRSQGQVGTDIDDLRKLKKKLMDGVIANMGESVGFAEKRKQKKQEKMQKLILDINGKLENASDVLDRRPEEIKRANADLLMECMRVWYEKLDQNSQEVKEISKWVDEVRERLKEKLLLKQDLEMENNAIYSYMHTLLGAKMMEQIDKNMENDK